MILVEKVTLQKIVSLCKRRGFVFPSSEIYGGLANVYDFGPLGVLLLRNIINSWWKFFVEKREDMYGLDTSILMSPKVWVASGHTISFADTLIDCRNCKTRTRADHLIVDFFEKKGVLRNVEGLSLDELGKIIKENNIPCAGCGGHDLTVPRKFNLLFETNVGILSEEQSKTYLRGEIAQGMFVNFKNVLDTMRPRFPFGIAQVGKAFRNEITLGNFIFRNLEFYLAELEYFFDPEEQDWKEIFEYWKKEMEVWASDIGFDRNLLSWRLHTDEERSHYSTKTEDLDFDFPFGRKEMFGLAYRTDFDLKNHVEKSDMDLKFIPHVIEPTFGLNRVFLALLANSYVESEEHTVLRIHKDLAPYRTAVFPLVRNKEQIVGKARSVFMMLKQEFSTVFDDRGNIGQRYFSQDEIGTPYCITIDYQTLEDDTVTIRDRDTTKQERVLISELIQVLKR